MEALSRSYTSEPVEAQLADTLADLRRSWKEDPDWADGYDEAYPHEAAADAIIALRSDLGWTQTQLAVRIGATQSVISRAESGRQSFQIGLLDRIAEAAGVTWRPVFSPLPGPLSDLGNVVRLPGKVQVLRLSGEAKPGQVIR